ncbi:MAG: hypothetical protein WKG06_07075 [Segetibacter sp.]
MAQLEATLISKVDLGDDGKLILSDKNWELRWNKACNLTALDMSVESLMNLPFIKSIIK